MQNKTIIIGIFILIAAACAFFTVSDLRLNKMIMELDKKKEKELIVQVVAEKETIKKDFEEKYRADMVSFEAMHKRLEIEKQKVRDLEGKIKKDKNS